MVLLPEPLGPMRPWMVPGMTRRSTWLRALRPPNCMTTCSISSSGLPACTWGAAADQTWASSPWASMTAWAWNRPGRRVESAVADEAPDAVGQVIDDEQDHRAEDGQLVVGDLLQQQGEGEEGDAERHGDGDGASCLRPCACATAPATHGHRGDDAGDDAELPDVGQQVRQHDDDDRAQDRPDAALAAAQGDGQQELDRQLDAEVVGGDILLGVGEQHAGQARPGRRCTRRP